MIGHQARSQRDGKTTPKVQRGKRREDVTLLDVLVDGFEKNEILDGFHWRNLPTADEAEAVRKLRDFGEEARQWKGAPTREEVDGARRILAWPDLEIRQAGRGLMVRARSAFFSDWWHDRATWEGDPMGPIYEWLREEELSAEA